MILECPACGARYRVADDAIPPAGKNVRCAKCQHGWWQAGAAAEVAPETARAVPASPPPAPPVKAGGEQVGGGLEAIAAEPELTDPLPADDPPAPAHWLWTVFAVMVGLGLSAAAFLIQNPALPPLDLTRIPYVGDALDALVYPPAPPPVPLRLTAGAEFRTVAGGRRMVVLTGSVTNPTALAQAVPPIEALLLDSQRHALLRWRIAAPTAVLMAGRGAAFDSSTFNVPAAGTTVTLRFATPD